MLLLLLLPSVEEKSIFKCTLIFSWHEQFFNLFPVIALHTARSLLAHKQTDTLLHTCAESRGVSDGRVKLSPSSKP